jgi:hypothetical protein
LGIPGGFNPGTSPFGPHPGPGPTAGVHPASGASPFNSDRSRLVVDWVRRQLYAPGFKGAMDQVPLRLAHAMPGDYARRVKASRLTTDRYAATFKEKTDLKSVCQQTSKLKDLDALKCTVLIAFGSQPKQVAAFRKDAAGQWCLFDPKHPDEPLEMKSPMSFLGELQQTIAPHLTMKYRVEIYELRDKTPPRDPRALYIDLDELPHDDAASVLSVHAPSHAFTHGSEEGDNFGAGVGGS